MGTVPFFWRRVRIFCVSMLLIAAALEEELRMARDLCPGCARIASGGVRLWHSQSAGGPVAFLKTGMGPRSASIKLLAAFEVLKPSRILVFGYAGALDPTLRVGDLVAVQRTVLLGKDVPRGTPLESMAAGVPIELYLHNLGDELRRGDVVTTPFIIGEPAQKAFLFERFRAAAVDMETAAFALAAQSAAIPLSCVRAITDDAKDEFLAPVSYAPGTSPGGRAFRAITAGNWVRRYKDWTERAAIARRSLRAFLLEYLQKI
jgi:adenosylhomocysteine nucleosidase